MFFTVSHVRPDKTAEIIHTRMSTLPVAATMVSLRAFRIDGRLTESHTFGNTLMATMTRANREAPDGERLVGAELEYGDTGHIFRIDDSEFPPNICGCCGALNRPGNDPFAGMDDAYCPGCYTADRNVVECLPENSAHVSPWSISPKDALWSIEIVFEPAKGETDSEVRYSAHPDAHDLWDDETNALIAMPGLTAKQILSATISKIEKD